MKKRFERARKFLEQHTSETERACDLEADTKRIRETVESYRFMHQLRYDPILNFDAGCVLEKRGKNELARLCYQRALDLVEHDHSKLSEVDSRTISQLASYAKRLGRLQQAISLYEMSLARRSEKPPHILTELASLYTETEDYVNARKVAMKALQLSKDQTHPNFFLGISYFRLDRSSFAKGYFRKLAEGTSNEMPVLGNAGLARVAIYQGELTEAQSCLSAAQSAGLNGKYASFLITELSLAQGKTELTQQEREAAGNITGLKDQSTWGILKYLFTPEEKERLSQKTIDYLESQS